MLLLVGCSFLHPRAQFDLAGSARIEVLISVIEPRQASQIVKELTELLPLEQAKVRPHRRVVVGGTFRCMLQSASTLRERLPVPTCVTDFVAHGLCGGTTTVQQQRDQLWSRVTAVDCCCVLDCIMSTVWTSLVVGAARDDAMCMYQVYQLRGTRGGYAVSRPGSPSWFVIGLQSFVLD